MGGTGELLHQEEERDQMSNKVKLFILITCTAAAVLFGLFAYFATRGPAVLASRLPLPSGSGPYVVFETKDDLFPISLSDLLTEGQFAVFREGSSGNNILSIAKTGEECAVLAEDSGRGIIDIYAAVRLTHEEISSLSKGELPSSWEKELGISEVIKAGDNGSWEIRTKESSIFYRTERDIALIAHDRDSFSDILGVKSGSLKSISGKIWEKEKSWPAHMIISDGGLLFANEEEKEPLVLQAAWRIQREGNSSGKAGEAVWRIEGLDKRISPVFLKALKPKTWDTANLVIPEPLLLSAGINLPEINGSPEEWPFPLSTIGELGTTIGLDKEEIRKILSGQTIFSVGGYNKLLWFSLPGIMAEFTGDEDLMKKLVDAFWGKLFFGAEPKPLQGFDFGGTSNVPFSVVGAGRENIALLGLLSPESVIGTGKLETFMKKNEKAIGWVLADLPKVGAAISDMTKMSAFMNEPDINDEEYNEDDPGDIFQQGSSFSPFDQGISDSFGKVLKGMGKAVIVWESVDSGSIRWFNETPK